MLLAYNLKTQWKFPFSLENNSLKREISNKWTKVMRLKEKFLLWYGAKKKKMFLYPFFIVNFLLTSKSTLEISIPIIVKHHPNPPSIFHRIPANIELECLINKFKGKQQTSTGTWRNLNMYVAHTHDCARYRLVSQFSSCHAECEHLCFTLYSGDIWQKKNKFLVLVSR